MIKLNLGSGYTKMDGYVNIDIDKNWNPDIVCDIRKLPYPDDHADEIFSSHTLEHFYIRECHDVLKEWKRILKKDCPIVLVVPNVQNAAKLFVENKIPDEFFLERLAGADQQATEYMPHYNWFWNRRLMLILAQCGFRNMQILDDGWDLAMQAVK